MNPNTNDKELIRSQAAQLFDRYNVLMELRNSTADRATWMKLDHEAKKVWHEWLRLNQMLTMISDPASYSIEQGGAAS